MKNTDFQKWLNNNYRASVYPDYLLPKDCDYPLTDIREATAKFFQPTPSPEPSKDMYSDVFEWEEAQRKSMQKLTTDKKPEPKAKDMPDKKTIVDSIYKAYGSDSGVLFGIKERKIVEAIVEFTINKLNI